MATVVNAKFTRRKRTLDEMLSVIYQYIVHGIAHSVYRLTGSFKLPPV